MKRLLRLLLLILVIAGFWWLIQNENLPAASNPVQQMADKAAIALQEGAQKVAATVSAPPPLRATSPAASSTLTRAGVLQWTNYWRNQNGVKPLTINATLNAAAEKKLADMFAKQYFEHVSPTGIGPGDLAKSVGYDYIEEGENLALGDYAGDKGLVQAWMDSPGHRANILHATYTEIGIAVGKGTYEGHTTWLAVQEFGRPVSACPKIDEMLKAKIAADRAQLDALKAQADQLRADIQNAPQPRTKEERDAYNAKVDQYNALVAQINPLVNQLQGEIAVYNGQVEAYNTCANA